MADAVGHRRNVVDVRLRHHGRHHGVDIAHAEFVVAMHLSELVQAVHGTEHFAQQGHGPRVRHHGRRLVEVFALRA
jgi:hypothetical protein